MDVKLICSNVCRLYECLNSKTQHVYSFNALSKRNSSRGLWRTVKSHYFGKQCHMHVAYIFEINHARHLLGGGEVNKLACD